MTPRFLPSARTTNWLLIVGFLSLGYALYLRYMAVENVPVGLACDAGASMWVCLTRKIVLALDNNGVFGWVALGAAILTLIRPSAPLFAIALAFTGFGLVLHNASLAGLAAALLVLSFARPVHAEA
jgi:hypothetical protein